MARARAKTRLPFDALAAYTMIVTVAAMFAVMAAATGNLQYFSIAAWLVFSAVVMSVRRRQLSRTGASLEGLAEHVGLTGWALPAVGWTGLAAAVIPFVWLFAEH